MNTEELLKKATSFLIWGLDDSHSFDITVEIRHKKEGRWAVRYGGCCYNKVNKDFEYEMLPSSRPEKWLQQTRFSLEEAVALAQQMADVFEQSRQETLDNPIEFNLAVQENLIKSGICKPCKPYKEPKKK